MNGMRIKVGCRKIPTPSGTDMASEDKSNSITHDGLDLPLLCALKEGDVAPSLSLTAGDGRLVNSNDLLRGGPMVLTFYRGVWCPYCQRDLKALAATAGVIRAYGASLVAVAHQTVPDSNHKFERENKLGFSILDNANGLGAAALGIG
jgi:peroxiredoxin